MQLRQQTPNHTGSLLVALPTLLDSNFRRTILFLSHHDPEEGSMAFIMNRPREFSLSDLADLANPATTLTPVSGGAEQIPVYEGGPVEHKSLIVARIHWHEEQAVFRSLGEEEIPSPLLSGEDHEEVRAFTGYAGWSAGQLEREIEERSWIILPPTVDLLLPVETAEEGIARWRAIMKKLGPWYHLMAQAPDELGMN